MRLPFGSYIKKLRQDHQLTLRQVAATIDIDQSTLAKIEKNKMIAPQYIIKGLGALYNLDFEQLQVHYLSEKLQYTYANVPYVLEAMEQSLEMMKSQQFISEERTTIGRKLNEYFEQKPVEKVWLFGSLLSKDFGPKSDIDLIVRFTNQHDLDLFDYMTMSDELAELLNRPIDLVAEGYLDDQIADQVNQEKELVYEKR